jgi:ribonuclease III
LLNWIRINFSASRSTYKKFKRILGFYPKNIGLYELALIHKSASIRHSDGKLVNNERLEYLGDSILDAIISDYLFSLFPDKDEGFLSKVRSKLVKRKHLNVLAEKIGIQQLLVSNTDNCGEIKHIYGDAFEALIGAVYLDMGYEKTSAFISQQLIARHINIEEIINSESDYKSRIIEWAQKNHKDILFENEELYQESGKSPIFVSRVRVAYECLGEGRGSSKKEAEQNAAEDAYMKQSILPNGQKQESS